MKSKTRIIWLSTCLGVLGTSIFLLVVTKASRLKDAQAKIGDGGFLTGEPCGPPCFLGIVPGVTRETEAVQIMKGQGLYENCDSFDNESESGLRGFSCSNLIVAVTFFRGTDVIGAIGFDPSQQLTVDMIITEFGEPDAVLVFSNWFNWNPEPTTSMSLIYNGIETSIGLGEQQGNRFTIAPTTLVDRINYSDPTFPSIPERASWNKLLSSWHGYGEYADERP